MCRKRRGSGIGGATLVWLGVVLLPGPPAMAARTITTETYLDKVRGMWFGQLIGNHSGRSLEGQYATREPAPDNAFQWVIKTSYEDPWTGDDDTALEYVYLHCLQTCGIAPTYAQIKTEWDDHIPRGSVYIANRQAKFLMQYGFVPPDTGTYRNNMHAWAIDAQIATESLGSLAPGMRQWAIDAVGKFGRVSNEGFALHAAQFYAAMYAAAAFQTDVNMLVAAGQAAIPTSSRSWRAIQNVRDWYADDLLDGTPDWRETRRKIYDYYDGPYDYGRYRSWVESTINLAITTAALLYGQADFEQTVRIAVLSGYDADCNPATAAGLIGMVLGYEALPAELTGPATDYYKLLNRPGLPEYDTITNVAARLRAIAENVIVANGGTVADGIYSLPDADPVSPEPEKPDPPGPTGLVATVLNAGQTVTVSASVERHNPLDDRSNLESIIDGITDVSHNGHLPYWTYHGEPPQPPSEDYYQLTFSLPVRFDALTFYEGDLWWSSINSDPRVLEPRGGYFENLAVDVHTDQGWTPASNLQMSAPLDPFAYYQVIRFDFDSIWGDAIRIRGQAGGTCKLTTIVELVAHGAIVASDFDGDGDVDAFDLDHLAACASGPAVPQTDPDCRDADLDGDTDVDQADFGLFQRSLTPP